MLFWPKKKTLQRIFYLAFSRPALSQQTVKPSVRTNHISNAQKCACIPKPHCSDLLVGEIWRDSWSKCCLSHYKWIPSLHQMSETRQGKTPASSQSAQLLWIVPSRPVSPRSCLNLQGNTTQLLFICAENHPCLVYQLELGDRRRRQHATQPQPTRDGHAPSDHERD